jgi:hypothetical protein
VTDRRAVWAAAASLVGTIGGTAFVAGIIARLPFVWIIGLIVIALSALGFTSLLSGWPMPSLAKSDPSPSAVFPEPDKELPTFMIPTWGSEEQEMHQLGPVSWLPGFGPRDPDVTLRAIVALPAVSARDYSGELATAVRGEARESWLIDLLDSATLTTWLKNPWTPSPWSAEPIWQVRGSGFADLTELVFAPSLDPKNVLPFLARCAVLTGWRPTADGTQKKALRFLVELQFDRGASVSHRGDLDSVSEVPKLSLDEIARDFVRLLSALDLSAEVANHLLPGADLSAGYFGLWLTVRGVMMEQVVELDGIDRVAGAISRSDAVATGLWRDPDGPVGESRGIVVANMLDELLESAGYRGVGRRFDWLR